MHTTSISQASVKACNSFMECSKVGSLFKFTPTKIAWSFLISFCKNFRRTQMMNRTNFHFKGFGQNTLVNISKKNTQQVLELGEYGVGACTVAPDVIDGFMKNATVTSAVEDFQKNFKALCGVGKTMLDCE